jgi:CBS domain-containing protein
MQVLPKRLRCESGSNLASVVYRFRSSHTPLLVFDKDDNFLGLLTVKKVLLKRRYNPTTQVESCVIGAPHITKETKERVILKSMLDLGLYTLPVFDNQKKVIGVVTAKKILRKLMRNRLLAEAVAEKQIRKKAAVIPKNSQVRDAFNIFLKESISKLVVVEENGKMAGVVTKRDILSEYLSKSKRQRFSTRAVPKNYSFDKEQVKRGDEPISLFYSPGGDVYDEKISNYQAIMNLIKSNYNTIVLVDKNQKPMQLVGTKNVLEAVYGLMSTTENIPTVVTDLPKDLSKKEKGEVLVELKKLAEWINRQERVQWLKFVTRVVLSPKRKSNEFETRVKVYTDKETYNSNPIDKDFWSAFKESVRQIRKQVTRKD